MNSNWFEGYNYNHQENRGSPSTNNGNESIPSFTDCAFGMWKITMKKDENWKNGTCTCPVYYKQFICKHIIGIAIILKLVKCPPQAKNVPLGQKRKRGRPCNAVLGLSDNEEEFEL